MNKKRLWLIVQTIVAAGFVLFGFWRLLLVEPLLASAQEEPTVIREQRTVLRSSQPEPRWLELVRSRMDINPATVQASPISINLNLTDYFVAGRVPTLSPVMVQLVHQGMVLGSKEILPVPDAGGGFYLTSLEWTDDYSYYYGISTDDEIRVSQAGTVVSATVPILTAYADTSLEQIFGQAPAGAALELYLFPELEPANIYTETGTVDGSGYYRVNWSNPGGIQPRDQGYVVFAPAPDSQIYVRYRAPYLRVQVLGSVLSGYLAPGESGFFEVKKIDGRQFINTVYADANGYFYRDNYLAFIKSLPWVFSAGDVVSITTSTQTLSMTVQNIRVEADRSSGQVSGHAPSGTLVTVANWGGPISRELYYPGETPDLWETPPQTQFALTTDTDGTFSSALALQPGDYGAASIKDAQGYDTYTRFTDPYLSVALGSEFTPNFQGQVNLFSAPIEIEVIGPSGYLKDILSTYTDDDGAIVVNSDYLYPPPPSKSQLKVDSGDIVRVQADEGLQAELILPLLTANADLETGIISGQASSNATLAVSIFDQQATMTLVVTATADGFYLADFSSQGGFSDQAYGNVIWSSPQGHQVRREFSVISTCPPSPQSIQVNGDRFSGQYKSDDCQETTYRLTDANGRLKTDRVDQTRIPNMRFIDADGNPVRILAGDHLEIDSREGALSIPIPELSVSVDPNLELFLGTAPPGSVVELEYHSGEYLYPVAERFTTTVSTSGRYTATIPVDAPFTAGDSLTANIDQMGIQFYAKGGLPMLRASLYGATVGGWLEPVLPYTLTHQRGSVLLDTVTGFAGSDGVVEASLSELELPGDVLTVKSMGQTFQIIVPDISVAVYLRENRVAGQAPANSHLLVRIEKDYLTYLQPVMAGPDGVFEAGFDWAPDFTTISGSVLQYTDPASQTLLRYSTPIWKITLGNICVQGNGSLPSVPFTATLISASSGISQTYHATTSSSTGAYSACFGQPIHSGDRYSFTDPNYQSDDILPLVTAEHDFYRQVLEGTAWPDSEITVSFLGNPYPYIGGLYQEATRHTRSDASGAYGLDTSDLVLGPGQNAYIVTSDESGNQIVKFFRVTGYRQNFPFMAVEP